MNALTRTLTTLTLVACASTCAAAAPEEGLHLLMGVRLTQGGGLLAGLQFADGSYHTLSGGRGYVLYGGVEFQRGPLVAQLTLGQHTDASGSGSADLTFRRRPVEALGLWQLTDQLRLGGGLRLDTGATLRGPGAASVTAVSPVDSHPAIVLEGEYLLGQGIGLTLRYVKERFTVEQHSIDTKHLGLGLSYRF